MPRSYTVGLALIIGLIPPVVACKAQAPPAIHPISTPTPIQEGPVFRPLKQAVSTWRTEAAANLELTPDQVAAFLGPSAPPRVVRCVKLNNYWCIKKAGWNGEIAADGEGHVAFASAVEGAAVAALLLKRYYVDFDRRTATSIISHWAPAACGDQTSGGLASSGLMARDGHRLAPKGLRNTLRARWLGGHARGSPIAISNGKSKVRRSVVADHMSRMMPTPMIAAGLGGMGQLIRPMTLDALLMSSPNAPPSRSMLGLPKGHKTGGGKTAAIQLGSTLSCGNDSARIAAYAATAAAGVPLGPDGDLALFAADGTPTANLAIMMANMARVEIGPFGATPALIAEGIAQAFKPGRNPAKS